MDLWQYIGGIVTAEITGADLQGTLLEVAKENIEIRNIQQESELTCCLTIDRKAYGRLERICRRRGDRVSYRKKSGLYWYVRRGMRRPILAFGSLLLMMLILWVPTRVLFISVEGNDTIPERRILEAAGESGICFGASRREVRSEKVKNRLLSAVPQLQWAGVNTSGCTAVISVREKSVPDEDNPEPAPASIEASRDGQIVSCTVTAGELRVVPGMLVKEGQTLISAYTDCGRCIRVERADGEIMARTRRAVEAVFPSSYAKKGERWTVKRKISLLIRKKRIFLWKDSGIWDSSCDRMYEEYYVTLPGGFRLPVALCVEEYRVFETSMEYISPQEAEMALKAFADDYLVHRMVAGSIIGSSETITSENGLYRLRGEYDCIEMIGQVRQEQIGDINGENS